jgi:MarR family 2-MHQ and catechol resistance regulon transcriptional repressor
MTLVDERARDLQHVFTDIFKQFHSVNEMAASGPHTHLNMQELRTIEVLGSEGPRIMRELAEHVAVAVNSMTSIVDSVERKSLVRRNRSDEDRRTVRVELTDAGRKSYQSLAEVKLQLYRTMLSALTEEEQTILMVLLSKIARAGRTQAPAPHRPTDE